MSGEMWEVIEAKAGKVRMAEIEGRRTERRSRKEEGKEKRIEVQKVVEEQEIWDKEKKVAKSEVEVKKLVPERFHKQIQVFGKKVSEWMPTRKL